MRVTYLGAMEQLPLKWSDGTANSWPTLLGARRVLDNSSPLYESCFFFFFLIRLVFGGAYSRLSTLAGLVSNRRLLAWHWGIGGCVTPAGQFERQSCTEHHVGFQFAVKVSKHSQNHSFAAGLRWIVMRLLDPRDTVPAGPTVAG
jgi:hypothetical protein